MARPKTQTLHDLDLPLSAIPITQHFAPKDDSRPVLAGLHVMAGEGTNYVIAADGYCAARSAIPDRRDAIERDGNPDLFTGSVIIPREALIAASRIMVRGVPLTIRKETDRWFIGQYATLATVGKRGVSVPDLWLSFKPIEGTIPNLAQIFDDAQQKSDDPDRQPGRFVALAPDLFGKVVSVAKAMGGDRQYNERVIKLTLNGEYEVTQFTTQGDPGIAVTMLVMPVVAQD